MNVMYNRVQSEKKKKKQTDPIWHRPDKLCWDHFIKSRTRTANITVSKISLVLGLVEKTQPWCKLIVIKHHVTTCWPVLPRNKLISSYASQSWLLQSLSWWANHFSSLPPFTVVIPKPSLDKPVEQLLLLSHSNISTFAPLLRRRRKGASRRGWAGELARNSLEEKVSWWPSGMYEAL